MLSIPTNCKPYLLTLPKHVLRLSEILQFYTADFLAVAPSLASYVNRYRVALVPENYEVEFIPYDWTINRQPGT